MSDPKTEIIKNLALVNDMDDLLEINNEHLKAAFDRVRKQGVKQFSPGDVVEYSLKGGKTARGKVVKRNTKTVSVDITHIDGVEKPFAGGHNVPPSMLTRVDES